MQTIGSAIPQSWMHGNGLRLDARPYLSGAFEAEMIIKGLSVEKDRLCQVTKGGMQGIFNGPRFPRTYVEDPSYGVPFLGSTDILAADLSNLPLISKKQVANNPELLLDQGWTLITCSGTIGRMAYSRSDMVGMAGSQHFMRVVPDPARIPPGYLYAYLSSRYGVPQVVGGTYGAIIQHIEPGHIKDLQVPRLGDKLEGNVHALIDQAARLRSDYQRQVQAATDMLFALVGLRDITAAEWHAQGPDLGFTQPLEAPASLRALNFNPRFQQLMHNLSKVQHKVTVHCWGKELLGWGDRRVTQPCQTFGKRI